jgi:uncharacterized protein YceK
MFTAKWVGRALLAVTLVGFVVSSGGCASVVSNTKPGTFREFTARALRVNPASVTTWNEEQAGDGPWRWKAIDKSNRVYTCTTPKNLSTISCAEDYLGTLLNLWD